MPPIPNPAHDARHADRHALRDALVDARRRTLATFAAYEAGLAQSGLAVPYSAQLNPPLWELGHVGWFQDWWIARNPQRALGAAADPDAARVAPRRSGVDAMFDSGRIAHRDRWALALPSPDALRDDLMQGLQQTLALLDAIDDSDARDAALYFFRLCLFHEDMHHEAAVYMAQHLDLALAGRGPDAHPASASIALPAVQHVSGAPETGFAFDNELGRHAVELAAFEIDAAPVTWGAYLRFVEAGGYETRCCWSDDGWAWLQAQGLHAPRYLRRHGDLWQRRGFGNWADVDAALPAMNLSCFEAEAWCAWAGRRLPTEAEWESAAERGGDGHAWGQVWEWTASTFAPYPDFAPHPYRDYSQPWFGTRRVLRGGSFATHARMKHVRYRNFYTPDRNDIYAGFRTCAADASPAAAR
ncbi:MAG: SUMF1/EgtB/PvdO family nonheme iron enzyme [Proteobacteria bacterium]|nr:SUMF1/EgtB/PvdO family nonheme iron enzyme [Pseudomonadota bacterium]